MTDLTALVAILTGALSSASTLGTVTRNVASNTALIASLGLPRTLMALRAVTAHVTFFIAVVASKDATVWTVASLMSNLAAVVAGTARRAGKTRIHLGGDGKLHGK